MDNDRIVFDIISFSKVWFYFRKLEKIEIEIYNF